MLRAFLLLLFCLADYETIRNLAHGAFTLGLVNLSALFCIGAAFIVRRFRFVRA